MKSRERVWMIIGGVLMQMKPIHDGIIYISVFRTLIESTKSLNTHESTKAFKTVPLSVHQRITNGPCHCGRPYKIILLSERLKLSDI